MTKSQTKKFQKEQVQEGNFGVALQKEDELIGHLLRHSGLVNTIIEGYTVEKEEYKKTTVIVYKPDYKHYQMWKLYRNEEESTGKS